MHLWPEPYWPARSPKSDGAFVLWDTKGHGPRADSKAWEAAFRPHTHMTREQQRLTRGQSTCCKPPAVRVGRWQLGAEGQPVTRWPGKDWKPSMLAPASRGVPPGSCPEPPSVATAANPAPDALPAVPTLAMGTSGPAATLSAGPQGGGLSDPGSSASLHGAPHLGLRHTGHRRAASKCQDRLQSRPRKCLCGTPVLGLSLLSFEMGRCHPC